MTATITNMTVLDALFEPLMHEAVSEIGQTSPFLEQTAAYHLGWLDRDFAPVDNIRSHSGKRIRPKLAMLVTAGLGADPSLAIPIAAAIELLHNFTLVHDDIQDKSELRRHRPTVWSLWGEAQAINTGDALFAASHLALYMIADRPETTTRLASLARAFDRTTLAIVGGQTLDIENEGDPSVTPERYLQTITGKTAAIVEFSAWAGGVVAGATDDQLTALAEFGLATGLAFQIRDDALGIWGTEAETGKTPADDLRRRKQTLPILELRTHLDPAERVELDMFYSNTHSTDVEITRMLELLSKYDVRSQIENEIHGWHDRATQFLHTAIPRGANPAAEQLYILLDTLETRTS